MNSPQASSRWALHTLAILAILYTIHVARDVLLPITLALVFALILAPAQKQLERSRLPRAAASLLLVSLLVAVLGAGVYLLSASAMDWLRRLPEASESLVQLYATVQEEVAEVDLATREMEAIAAEMSPGEEAGVQRVIVQGQGWRSDLLRSASELVVYGGLFVVLLFFLLTSSEQLIGRIVGALPQRQDRLRALRATAEAQAQMSRFLVTATVVNLCFGLVVGTGLWLAGFPDPALWGAVAAALRFAPFIGAWTTLALLTVVALISFDALWVSFAVPAAFLLFSTLVGQFVDPLVYGLRFRLSPIVVFVWIFFWGWLWGAPGILLAVPLLVLLQVSAQHVAALEPLSRVLGDPPRAGTAGRN